ncbi:arylsulfatase B-like [Rhipicephalus sanguineus]|uniref:arylsulfatase B-like n=1 Tax=Rhipicephalus sanguineus TaxID=34632 RepID=UPI0020C4CE61|nr:arylsulfatase B-like [Rhipicephalus sanguineus]
MTPMYEFTTPPPKRPPVTHVVAPPVSGNGIVWVCLGTCGLSTSTDSSTPPHIIFILADDIGWNDVSFHGSRQIPTPNIDALAATGVILQRHYSASTCTPSRTALLTSVYPARTNVGYVAYPPASEQSLSLRFELLPQWLKRLGYSTHMIGKWHLGYSSVEHTPTWRGFDTFFGYYNFGGFYFNHSVEWQGHCGVDLWHNVGHSMQPVTDLNGVYSTHAFTRRATQIIAEHDLRKPLFLFLSHQGIHATCDNCTTEAPRENTDKFAYIEQHNRTVLAASFGRPFHGACAGALDVLDESVGQVLAALQQRDMLARSVVVFASDNGAAPLATVNSELPNGGNNWPLRGTKEGAWEGGVRTTALLWSASLRDTLPRPPSQQLMHTVDWGPTLYAVAGGNVSELGDVDGSDLWYELSTGKGVGRSEALLQLGDRDELSAIISGRQELKLRNPFPEIPLGGGWVT